MFSLQKARFQNCSYVSSVEIDPSDFGGLNSILQNRVVIFSPSEKLERNVTVGQIAFAILRELNRESNAVRCKLHLMGSSITNACVAPIYPGYNDIDLGVECITGLEDKHACYLKIEALLKRAFQTFIAPFEGNSSWKALSIKEIPFTLLDLDHSFVLYKIKAKQSVTGTHVPLDIPVHFISHQDVPLYANNGDSFYVPLNIFDEKFLGTFEGQKFQLFSREGDCRVVVEQIKLRIITSNVADSIDKFGWYRYLMAVTEWGVSPDKYLNETFYKKNASLGDAIVDEVNRFIEKKRHFTEYPLLLKMNAVFHAPEQSRVREALIKNVSHLFTDHKENGAPWILFFKEVLQNSPSSLLPLLLKILVPLLAEETVFVWHLGEIQMRCRFFCERHSFYIQIPFVNETDEIFFQEVLQFISELNLQNASKFSRESPRFKNVFSLEAVPFSCGMSLFKRFCDLNHPLAKEIAGAWFLEFSSTEKSFLHKLAWSLLRKEKWTSYFTRKIEFMKFLIEEEELGKNVLLAIEERKTSSSICLLCLLSKKLSCSEMDFLLQEIDFNRTSLEHKTIFQENIPYLISETVRQRDIVVLSNLLTKVLFLYGQEEWAQMAFVAVEDLLKTHETSLSELTSSDWDSLKSILFQVLGTSPDPWKSLFIWLTLKLSFKDQIPQKEFLWDLWKFTNKVPLKKCRECFPDDSYRFAYSLKAFSLLQEIDPQAANNQAKQALNYAITPETQAFFNTYRPFDLSFMKEFFIQVLRDEGTEKALRLLTYYGESKGYEEIFSFYENLQNSAEIDEAIIQVVYRLQNIEEAYLLFCGRPQIVLGIESFPGFSEAIRNSNTDFKDFIQTRIRDVISSQGLKQGLDLLQILSRKGFKDIYIVNALHFLLQEFMEKYPKKRDLVLLFIEQEFSHLRYQIFSSLFRAKEAISLHPSILKLVAQSADLEEESRLCYFAREPPMSA